MLQKNIQEFQRQGELISPAEVLNGRKLLPNGLSLFSNAPARQFSLTQVLDLSTPASCQLRQGHFGHGFAAPRLSVAASPATPFQSKITLGNNGAFFSVRHQPSLDANGQYRK